MSAQRLALERPTATDYPHAESVAAGPLQSAPSTGSATSDQVSLPDSLK